MLGHRHIITLTLQKVYQWSNGQFIVNMVKPYIFYLAYFFSSFLGLYKSLKVLYSFFCGKLLSETFLVRHNIWVETARMDILSKTGHILLDFESLL